MTSLQVSVPETIPTTPNEIVEWLKTHQTPLDMVSARIGRGGGLWYYLRHQYVTEVLNRICAFDWDNEIIREYVSGDELTVLVRLRLRLPMGDGKAKEVVHEAWGGGTIHRYGKNHDRAGEIMEGAYADAHNAAASLGLTKAATRLGLGLDLSVPIKAKTLRHLHAVGNPLFTDWDRARGVCVRVTTGGRTGADGLPSTSANDLLDIEARFLISILEALAESIQTKAPPRYHSANAASLAASLVPSIKPFIKTGE